MNRYFILKHSTICLYVLMHALVLYHLLHTEKTKVPMQSEKNANPEH